MAAGALLAFLLFGLVLWLLPAYLVYVHARNRGRDALLWTAIVLVAGLVGVVLYLLLGDSLDRDSVGNSPTVGSGQACPNCGARTETGARYCGDCGTELVAECPSCGARVSSDNSYCPDCGTGLGTTTGPGV